jgi:hypothetical protein
VRRGELYRVATSRTDPKRSRVFVVVSRQVLCDTAEYSSVICAVSSSRHGLTQVPVGEAEGLKHASATSTAWSACQDRLTDYREPRSPKLAALHVAPKIALDLLD